MVQFRVLQLIGTRYYSVGTRYTWIPSCTLLNYGQISIQTATHSLRKGINVLLLHIDVNLRPIIPYQFPLFSDHIHERASKNKWYIKKSICVNYRGSRGSGGNRCSQSVNYRDWEAKFENYGGNLAKSLKNTQIMIAPSVDKGWIVIWIHVGIC